MHRKAKRRNLRAIDSSSAPELSANYDKSWAVVIGINHYEHLNCLDRANLDAAGMAELLVSKLGFKKDNVFIVLDPPPDDLPRDLNVHSRRATKAVIEDLIFDRLPQLAKPNDRVLIFYAGHGDRRLVPESKLNSIGYLVPSDAVPDKWHTFIEWDAIMRAGDYCPAKHMFYLLDACYSGIAASRVTIKASHFSDNMLKARVREVLTAGTAKQAVADAGPKGHSLFTSYVLEGLSGAAGIFDKSIVTASELMVYVRNRVAPSKDSKQTPAFSTLDTEPGGDFVFVLPPQKKPASDLSRWVRILDQGPHGVPVSHAVVTAMEAYLRQQGTPVQLSPQKLVNLGRVLDADIGPDGGEYIITIVNAAQAFGVPVDKLERGSAKARANVGKARVDTSIPRANCNARCFLVEKVDDIPDQLALGRPVILGLSILESFYSNSSSKTGIWRMASNRDQLIGGHAVTIVGYNPEVDAFRFANSWGHKWGDRGFGTIGRETLEKCIITGEAMWAVEAKLFVWGT